MLILQRNDPLLHQPVVLYSITSGMMTMIIIMFRSKTTLKPVVLYSIAGVMLTMIKMVPVMIERMKTMVTMIMVLINHQEVGFDKRGFDDSTHRSRKTWL